MKFGGNCMNRTLTAFLISAGHLDIEWYQPMRSYRFWTMQIMKDLQHIDRECPDFKNYVLDGQVFPLEEYLRVVPEDAELLQKLIRRGMLTVGPFYTQFDEWLISAEAMMRNCLYGIRKAKALGGVMKAGYLPDNFGHPIQLPQILRGFGIDSLLFMRGMPEVAQEHDDEFILRGPDGSEIVASHFRDSYGGAFPLSRKPMDSIQPRPVPYHEEYLGYEWHRELANHEDPASIARDMIDNVRAIKHRYPSGIVPLVSGFDHLPPQARLGECFRLANQLQSDIEFLWGTPEEYIRLVSSNMQNPLVIEEELIGSRYQYILFGSLSTRTYLKRRHFAAEILLERYVEPLSAVARLHGVPVARTLLDEAWTNLMINSAHDSIHGSSLDEVHIEMEARNAASRQIAAGLIHERLSDLAGMLHPWWGDKRAVLVFSPVGSDYPQPCEVWAAIGDREVTVVDRHGVRLPTQVLPRERVDYNSMGQPRNVLFPMEEYRKVLFSGTWEQGSLGSYALEEIQSVPTDPVQEPGVLENEYLRVQVNGACLDLLDKRTGRWYRNLNLIEEEADAGDAWDYSPTWPKTEKICSTQFPFLCTHVEHGPVCCAMEMKGIMFVPECLQGDQRSSGRVEMPVVFHIRLYTGLPRVEVKLTLGNSARDHRVRLRVPLGCKSDTILSQGHLAITERGVARPAERSHWIQPPTQLLPMREWAAADDGEAGLAIALRGVYDYEAFRDPVRGTTELAFTLVRGFSKMGRIHMAQRDGGASWAHDTPGAQCIGEQVIEWCYLPYCAETGEKAPFLPLAQSYLYPAVAHAIRRSTFGNTLPSDLGIPVSWEHSNLILSAFKPAQDDDDCILRFYENQGIPVEAKIQVKGFEEVSLANMDEHPLSRLEITDNAVVIPVGPYQCVTLKLHRKE